jgi:hypothetical protein
MNRADLELLCNWELSARAKRARKSSAEEQAAQQPDYRHATINVATAGDNIIVAATPGKRIRVYELFLWNVQQNTLIIRDGDRPLTGPITNFPAQSGLFLNYSGAPHFETSPGQPLVLNLSTANQVSGYVRYREE